MSQISAGAHVKLIIQPGEVYRVSTAGQATVVSAYGAPAGSVTVTATTKDFGPYSVPAKLIVNALQGSVTYMVVQKKDVQLNANSNGLELPDGSQFALKQLPTTQVDYTTVMAVFPGWNPANGGGPFPNAPWPAIPANRRPLPGVLDDSNQNHVDYQLEVMRDYGIKVACIEFYFIGDGSGGIRPDLIAFLNCYTASQVPNKPKFMIMWIVDTNAQIYNLANWPTVYRTFFPYFRDPNYFDIEGKPALMVFQASKFKERMGGNSSDVVTALQTIRAEMAPEFGGVHLSTICPDSSAFWMNDIPAQGWDAITAYTVFSKNQNGDNTAMAYPLGAGWDRFAEAVFGANQLGTEAGQTGTTFHSWCGNSGYPVPATYPAPTLTSTGWLGSAIPEVWPPTPTGWAPKPWNPDSTSDAIPTNAQFLDVCQRARAVVDAYRATKTKHGIVFFVAWNEFGEGQFVCPTVGQGYGKVEQIRATFSNNR